MTISQHPKYGNHCLTKFYWKNNGRNEIFEKKIQGKEVSHERAKPLLGLNWEDGWGSPLHFLHSPSANHPPPCLNLTTSITRDVEIERFLNEALPLWLLYLCRTSFKWFVFMQSLKSIRLLQPPWWSQTWRASIHREGSNWQLNYMRFPIK